MSESRPGTDAMFATLYSELRRLARRERARAGPNASLGATTLLHEAYLDMSQRDALAFPDEAHFLAYAARVMRTLILEGIRESGAQKRGGGIHITSLDTYTSETVAAPETVLAIGDALDELGSTDPDLAHVVDLKFFCGFSFAEIAALTQASERTVYRQWEKARTRLFGLLSEA
jgi:RNA polymerase sigma factor (TIGR02999 family)